MTSYWESKWHPIDSRNDILLRAEMTSYRNDILLRFEIKTETLMDCKSPNYLKLKVNFEILKFNNYKFKMNYMVIYTLIQLLLIGANSKNSSSSLR